MSYCTQSPVREVIMTQPCIKSVGVFYRETKCNMQVQCDHHNNPTYSLLVSKKKKKTTPPQREPML